MDGNTILAKALKQHGIDTLFYLMGGPMCDAQTACADEGMRLIDVRHEQAAAMMASAYARIKRRPAAVMAASGPGTANLVTGVANAWADGAPLIAIGGNSAVRDEGKLSFQETDQVAMFRPITRWAERCTDATRIPEFVAAAFRAAFGPQPGPVYLDMPGDIVYRKVPDETVHWVTPMNERPRAHGDPADIERAVELLGRAERPVLIFGSGALWSGAEEALRSFVDRFGIPFWTTPQGRGAIPEDHALSFLAARSTAFRECDAIVQIGTRQNYVFNFLRPPAWNPDARLIQVDTDVRELGRNRVPEVGIVGDARAVLQALVAAAPTSLKPARYQAWTERLARKERESQQKAEASMSTDAVPIHPARLCKEIRDWIPRDAIVVADGQEVLNIARRTIPFYLPRSINAGPWGTMGVGLPSALGAKVAMPDAPVVAIHGDGSFGFNAMELDTAVRHDLPIINIISNNNGWTAINPAKRRVGQVLADNRRYDLMFAPLGLFTKNVEHPSELRSVLDQALEAQARGQGSVINVVTDSTARAGGAKFTDYET